VWAGLVDGNTSVFVACPPHHSGAADAAVLPLKHTSATYERDTPDARRVAARRVGGSRRRSTPSRRQATMTSHKPTPCTRSRASPARHRQTRAAARAGSGPGSARSGCAGARSTGAPRARRPRESCRSTSTRVPASTTGGRPRRRVGISRAATPTAGSRSRGATPAKIASPSQWLCRNARKHAVRSRPRIRTRWYAASTAGHGHAGEVDRAHRALDAHPRHPATYTA